MIAARLDWEAFRAAVRAELLSRGEGDRPLSYVKAAQEIGLGKVTFTRLFGAQRVEAGAVLAICRWMDRDPFDFLLEVEPDADPHWQPKGIKRPKGQATKAGYSQIAERLRQGNANRTEAAS